MLRRVLPDPRRAKPAWKPWKRRHPSALPARRRYSTLAAVLCLVATGLTISPGCSSESDRDASFLEGDEEIERRLQVLGYADWDRSAPPQSLGKQGVVRISSGAVEPGLNLYHSQPRRRALLIDMRGELVHAWSSPESAGEGWHHVEPDRDGSLYAIVKYESLEKLDRNSRRLWKLDIAAHHDLAIDPAGSIYVLTRVLRRIEHGDREVPILDTDILEVSPEGEILGRFALSSLLAPLIPEARLDEIVRDLALIEPGQPIPGTPLDVFHTNSIEIVREKVPGIAEAGDLLLCVRSLDSVFVLSLDAKVLRWSWGKGVLENPHHPSLLPNGNILVFDNGTRRAWSRVVEVDPRLGEIVWEYRATPGRDFYSRTRGAAQALSNRNVLITESDRGRVIEVDRNGRIVWEFYNPDIDEAERARAAIYRMRRLEPGFARLGTTGQASSESLFGSGSPGTAD